jgi:GNAT superfamily N-acetyltransferase
MIRFRPARRDDLEAIVALLADDALGAARENTDDLAPYLIVFDEMAGDPNNLLIAGEADEEVVACYQLTIIPGISLGAKRRAQIEGVRVARRLRGQGHGRALIEDAEQRARSSGASLLQLTMNRTRKESAAFYASMGFDPSHTGFKKTL